MEDVLRRSVGERGPIDVVMSCCFEFPEMLNMGLPHYAFTVPFELLRAHRAQRQSITNGPRGIAAACRAAGARYFLPYAHGFGGLHVEPASAESKVSERAAVAAVRAELARCGATTEVLEWHPGDVLRWRDGAAIVER
jgi:hypothetical protein